MEVPGTGRKARIPFLAGTDSGFAVTPLRKWQARDRRIVALDLGFTLAEATAQSTVDTTRVPREVEDVGAVSADKLAGLAGVKDDHLADVAVPMRPAAIGASIPAAGRSGWIRPPRRAGTAERGAPRQRDEIYSRERVARLHTSTGLNPVTRGRYGRLSPKVSRRWSSSRGVRYCAAMGGPRLVHRLSAAREALGLPGVVRTAPRWLVRPVYLVLARNMSLPSAPAPGSGKIRWTLLGPDDLDRVHALNPALSVSEMRRRLQAGYRCLLAWVDDAIVMYRWSTTGQAEIDFLGLTLRLGPGDIYLAEVFTATEHRRKGIMLASAPNWIFADQAPRRTIALVAPWNRAAVRLGLERAGYEVVGTIGQWRLGPWRHTFSTGGVALEGRRAFRVLQ